jgi:outer membrane protein OmpA-like peptidoglycan-associated protein
MAVVAADPVSARARDVPRAAASPGRRQKGLARSDAVLALQRSAGNRAVGAMLRSPQGRTLARCAGACRCGGRCRDDELLEDEPRGTRRASVLARSPRKLARTGAEQQFALAHEGQVESTQVFVDGIPQENEEDVDEFVLWNFLVNSDVVRRGHKAKLDKVADRWAAELTADPLLRIRVLGYASVTGGTTLNDELSQRRAESVRDYLVGRGVPEEQIVIDSSGSRLPMDEGTSPESLARNRRVEISKFVATTVKDSLTDLGSGIEIKVRALDFAANTNLKDRVDGANVSFSLGKQRVRAQLEVKSSDPDVEVGFLQFVTKDVRLAGYNDADADGEVADFHVPPSSFTDYDHCLNAFGACRDVKFAKLPFSLTNRSGEPRRTTGPGGSPVDIFFETEPEIVLPIHIAVPERGGGVLTQVAWKMQFTIALVARKGDMIVPLKEHVEWDLSTLISMIVGPVPKELSRSLRAISEVNSRTNFFATRPLPDVERAMSLPTCTLRERMMNQLCKPTVHVADGGIGEEFDAELQRAMRELEDAFRKQVVPILGG